MTEIDLRALVVGGTGVVGRHMMHHLAVRGFQPTGLSRSARMEPGWIRGNVADPGAWIDQLQPCHTVYTSASIPLLVPAVSCFADNGVRRIVGISTTSVLTKLESVIAEERDALAGLVKGEEEFIAACERHGIGWTILRPTLIYDEGRDVNVTRLANLIRRYGVIPLAGRGSGLRQPVHAEDLAIGAIDAAASEAAVNRTYVVPGGETLTYREMVGRIFDGLGRRRKVVPVPAPLWRAAFKLAQPLFPRANFAMGDRMSKHMTFDASEAQRDFNWRPRGFRPRFTD
ncbi:NAD-dependent epimerase/dehydratase family protein [Bradyrhizobium prioriisuperbiae]|uniref:NAD-dependent epimerase/dehydratase family protein n=1 Tax=Bradyrhizobium prioriisuperbiae TaxID=2854389 RepID=UPI0028EFB425|nr:NAD-dependent epimerase/dehydratase family protein [Bradyrhizobium prioritasuperba]